MRASSSEVRLKYLDDLKQQESYGWRFGRLSDIGKGTTRDFSGWKILSKEKLMYLEVKLEEAKFN